MKAKRHNQGIFSFCYSLLPICLPLIGILPAKAQQLPPSPSESDSETVGNSSPLAAENEELATDTQVQLPLFKQIPTSASDLSSSTLEAIALLKASEKSTFNLQSTSHQTINQITPPRKQGGVSEAVINPKTAQVPSNTTPLEAQPTAPSTPVATDEVRIITPQTGVTASNSTNLVVQYPANKQILVSVNQEPLAANIATQTELNQANNLITQVWYNIPLKNGKNTLTARTEGGSPTSIELTVKEPTVQIEIAPVANPKVPADGRSTVTLEGRITDEKGELINKDAVITLTASAGKFAGTDQNEDQPGFQVLARAGQFTAQLQSTLQAQKVQIRAAIERYGADGKVPQGQKPNVIQPQTEITQLPSSSSQFLVAQEVQGYTQVEFVTYLRPSLVSGVVNFRVGPGGANFWGSRQDFLNPDNDGTQVNLNGAVFATGKLGEWLFTGAYNSERPLNQTCDRTTRLFRDTQFCEQNYPVYGDSSTVDYLTPSTDSLYLRFERASKTPGAEPDYLMWGDYQTSELARASQQFTATTRGLHGFKGNYSLGNLQITALYSKDVQGFQRDAIVPNGTSGYYFLSRRILFAGSENIFIEAEELNRPGTVVERKPLYRGVDYDIDYDRGTLMFRRPILATEFNPFGTTLVRRIIATYQYEGNSGNDTSIYGGRLQYNFSQSLNNQSFVGATYLRQDEGMQDFELFGADLLIPLGKGGQIVAEYGHSRNDSLFLGDVSGSAYRVEINGNITPFIQAQAFYKSVEENFSNNSTVSFTPGQTRYGAAIAAQVGSTTNLRAAYDHEVNFGIAPAIRTEFFDLFNPLPQAQPGTRVDNELTTVRLGLLQKLGAAQLSIDYLNRSREDRVSNLFDADSSQIVSQLSVPITSNLAFRAQNELNLTDSDPLYPNRTTVGLDWAVSPGVTMRLAHQFFDGGILRSNSITSLETLSEYRLGENTSITSRYSVLGGYNGVTGQGAIGLNHRWVLAPGLRVNANYERIASDVLNPTAAGPRFVQPYAFGQSTSSLGLLSGETYGIGIEYTDNPNFQASARFERHTGSGNDNTVITAAAAGKLSRSLTALVRYEQANFANQAIRGLGDSSTVKLGLAYRNPDSDQFNGLLRYEYRRNPSTIPETILIGSGTGSNEHILALEGIYAPNWQWEFYGKYAMRISSTDLAENFSSSSRVSLAQARTTYRLGYRTDLGAEARWIGQSGIGYNEWGLALDAGYYLTPDLRAYLGYSFGSVDDRDFTGYRSQGGVYFGVTLKVNELFRGFGRQKAVPQQQKESIVTTTKN